MLITILLLVAVSVTTPDEVVSKPRVLAETLAAADSIESVQARAHTITFRISRAGNAFDVIATTNRRDVVVAVAVHDRGRATHELGNLSWLVDVMKNSAAVSQLAVDDDGAVTLTTSDGWRYMAIPGRGSGGNAAVEARFAAAFDHTQ